jgi:hypothetical protein
VWAKDQRSVNELAVELGCDRHTINNTVLAYGTPRVEDPSRIGHLDALGLGLGLDETLFARLGRWRTRHWSTSIVDVRRGLGGSRSLRCSPPRFRLPIRSIL